MRLRVDGPISSVATLKKSLTITDKSVLWELGQRNKKAKKIRVKIDELKPQALIAKLPQYIAKYEILLKELEVLEAEIIELKQDLTVEYFGEIEGKLYVPPGAWWFGDVTNNDNITGEKYLGQPIINGMAPRPHQIEIVNTLLKYNRAAAISPTASGKTLILSMLCSHFVKLGKQVLLVEPTIELLTQTVNELKAAGLEVSGLGGPYHLDISKPIIVSTVNSALQVCDVVDVIALDEYQHSAAATYENVLLNALKATRVYGLSACNVRLDGNTIGNHVYVGPVVIEYDTKWGIDAGVLCKTNVKMVNIHSTPYVPDDSLSAIAYSRHTKHKSTLNTLKNLLSDSIIRGNKTLIIFKTVKAGEELKKFCKGEIDFSVASAEFRKPLNDFRDGKTQFLVSNTGLLAEGVNIPAIDCIINVSMAASENMTRQIIGRGLRNPPGKKDLIFYDITTNGYAQFARARETRLSIYKEFASNIDYLEIN